MKQLLTRWIDDERGATAMEYGLILALLAMVVIAAVTRLEKSISGKYNLISNTIK